MNARVPIALAEVATAAPWCQRGRTGRHSGRHVSEGGCDARRYRVEPISDAAARAWVVANHYSAGSAPPRGSARRDAGAAQPASTTSVDRPPPDQLALFLGV